MTLQPHLSNLSQVDGIETEWKREWMDGRMDGWEEGRMDGWDGWMDMGLTLLQHLFSNLMTVNPPDTLF